MAELLCTFARNPDPSGPEGFVDVWLLKTLQLSDSFYVFPDIGFLITTRLVFNPYRPHVDHLLHAI